jgi:hypothetical protein
MYERALPFGVHPPACTPQSTATQFFFLSLVHLARITSHPSAAGTQRPLTSPLIARMHSPAFHPLLSLGKPLVIAFSKTDGPCPIPRNHLANFLRCALRPIRALTLLISLACCRVFICPFALCPSVQRCVLHYALSNCHLHPQPERLQALAVCSPGNGPNFMRDPERRTCPRIP